jgi:glycerol-3-phosphate dehydrogenase
MLHGGLRYFEHGRIALVREALAERSAVSRMAPALARPRRFLVPLYRGGRLAPWKLRTGLQLYDWLAGRHALAPHASVRASEALELEPGLAPAGLLAAGIYSDVVMDDARLAVAVARDAVAHGATLHTYTEWTGVRPTEGGFEVRGRDTLDGTDHVFHARVLVNATGPWTDAVRRQLARALKPGTPEPEPLLRPSRGVHLVYPPLTQGHGLLLIAGSDRRVFFVVPLERHSLVGTTEVEIPSPPREDDFRPSLEEMRYLRAELGRALPAHAGTPPLAVLSGVRPLLASSGAVGEASREHRVFEEYGVLTVVGGKYTTFRVMARETLEHATRRLDPTRRIEDSEEPLPAPLAGEPTVDRLTEFAVESEFARRVDDVLRRRSALWLAPDRGLATAQRIAEIMAKKLGWSAERVREELQRVSAAWRDEEALLERTREDA